MKKRVLLISIVPPRNDCGGRIVMYRHLVERQPFELHVASNADFAEDLLIQTKLELPFPFQKIKKSRFGPILKNWITNYENFIWPMQRFPEIEKTIHQFKPDVILTLAENSLCYVALKLARRHKLPLAVFFLDWVPIMEGHFGWSFTRPILDRRFRKLYKDCDLALCTSDGMQEELGAHPTSHVVYPMPGKHRMPARCWPPKTDKFRLVYVGNAQGFYGRMLKRLLHSIDREEGMEIKVVGPHKDWSEAEVQSARNKEICLGAMSPDKAAEVIAGADALLVVMSFEKEHELFMRTSFTTKFLDYSVFGKPIILWGPSYCTPSRLAKRENAALIVESESPEGVIAAAKKLMDEPAEIQRLSTASRRLNQTVFSPDRLQEIFETQVNAVVSKSGQ